MSVIKDISKMLSKGDIEDAFAITKTLGSDEKAEAVEVARQAVIFAIKKGDAYKARAIKRTFGFSSELVEETLKQAVLSAFMDEGIGRVKELKDELPITKAMGKDIVEYCMTWAKKDKALALQSVFS